MPDLATLQREVAQGLLTGRYAGLEAQIMIGPIRPAEALGLHRNTVLHGLTNALRLTFPTIDALVGEPFFDQAALAYVEERPPSQACLTGYGDGFPDFLARYEFAADLPYLADVARFDVAVDAVGALAAGADGRALDLGDATLTLDASLRVLRLAYPADAVRDALDADDEAALTELDLTPGRRAYALWRAPAGAAARPLGHASAAFLDALLRGDGADDALAAAGAERQDLSVLQPEIFAAPFARLTLNAKPGPIP